LDVNLIIQAEFDEEMKISIKPDVFIKLVKLPLIFEVKESKTKKV